MTTVQVDMERKVVEKPPKYLGRPECGYPKCGRKSVGKYQEIPLCARHLEMAEFLEWYLNELVDKVGWKVKVHGQAK